MKITWRQIRDTRNSAFRNPKLVAANPSYPAQEQALVSANGLVQKGLSWIPQYDQINQVLDIAGRYGSETLAGDISPVDACTRIQRDAEDLIE